MNWHLRETGDSVTITVTRPDDRQGLYKAFAVGADGKYPLGTLTPQNGSLSLSRTLRRAALRDAGVWPVQRVECCLSFPFPAPQSAEALFPSDPILRRGFRAAPGARICSTAEGFTLTYPYRPNAPFPLTAIFCFARFTASAPPSVTFAFSPSGIPRFPADA